MDNARRKKTVSRMVWYCFHCGNWDTARAWGPPEYYYEFCPAEDWPVCYRCWDDIYPLAYVCLERRRGERTPDAASVSDILLAKAALRIALSEVFPYET